MLSAALAIVGAVLLGWMLRISSGTNGIRVAGAFVLAVVTPPLLLWGHFLASQGAIAAAYQDHSNVVSAWEVSLLMVVTALALLSIGGKRGLGLTTPGLLAQTALPALLARTHPFVAMAHRRLHFGAPARGRIRVIGYALWERRHNVLALRSAIGTRFATARPLARRQSSVVCEASVYNSRFTSRELAAKQAAWVEITRYLQRWVPRDGVVMDVATDRGDFIRNIGAGEKWACDIRDTSSALPPDVRFVQTDGLALTDHVPLGHFDVVFMSNYLEHLSASDQVVEQLRVARRLLKPGGLVIVLQPNIRHVGGAYWDYIDHRVALTERSLEEAATLAGFRTVKLISRFLPYTVKRWRPTHPWLVRAYLAFPPAWLVMGKQTLYVGETAG